MPNLVDMNLPDNELCQVVLAEFERHVQSMKSRLLTEIEKREERLDGMQSHLVTKQDPTNPTIQTFLSEHKSTIEKESEAVSHIEELAKTEQTRLEHALLTALAEAKSTEERASVLQNQIELSMKNVRSLIIAQLRDILL